MNEERTGKCLRQVEHIESILNIYIRMKIKLDSGRIRFLNIYNIYRVNNFVSSEPLLRGQLSLIINLFCPTSEIQV
jgi:hypothetical protein